MNLTTLLSVYHANSAEQPNNINIFVANALIFILENHIPQLALSFVLTLSCRDRHTCLFYNDLMEKIFHNCSSKVPPAQIVNVTPNGNSFVPGERQFNLIFVDSFESFRTINVINYTKHYNHNEYYLIFLQMRDDLLRKEMLRIFQYCWQNQIINCNIQIQTAKGEVHIYTYYPFTSGNCAIVTIKLINKFNGTQLINEKFFPKKLLNFYGCPLNVATWNVPPFLYLKYDNHNSGRILGGIEAHLVEALAKKLNFTIRIKVPPNNEQRGIILMEGNFTGALLMLHQRTVDFSLGSFRTAADRDKISSTTFSYYQTTQVICIPLKAYEFTSLEILLYPFAYSTWLLLLCIGLIVVIMVSIVNKVYKWQPKLFTNYTTRHSYLNILLLTIGMPATYMPVRNFARLLCTNWMFFTLILRTAYQALLFHMIRTQQRPHVPKTFEQLIRGNYTIVMNKAAYFSLKDVEFLQSLKLKMLDSVDDTIQFEFIEKYPRKYLAAAGPLDFLQYYASVNKKAGIFRILPQQLLSFPITMYLTKHSYLIDQFNEELLWMRSTGLINAWSNWELDNDYLNIQHYTKDNIFGLYELYMLFIMLLIGYTLAAIIFLLEIILGKFKLAKK